MATNLIKHLPKSGIVRRTSILQDFQTRFSSNTSSTTTQPPIRPDVASATRAGPGASSGSGGGDGLKLAVGLSLGLTVGFFAQDAIKKIFPNPEPVVPEKVMPTTDPIFIEQMINLDRKNNSLENQLSQLREEIRSLSQNEVRQKASANEISARTNGNVFGLSEVIQANNLANKTHYEQKLEQQRKALLREHLLKVEGEILKVENKYKPIINKIRELEAHLEAQRQSQLKEAPARLLWLSCQNLLKKLSDSPQEPLDKDPAYRILKQFAADDNSLAISILDSIPAKALKEGVQSETRLQQRFDRIQQICKRVALIDAQGAGLGLYMLSYLQSLFIFNRHEISDDEIYGRILVDPSKWSTFDILARVNYCLKEKNLEQAIRYANQLKGQARLVARDWIRDARDHLTTRQAFSTLSTHAEALAADAMLNNFNASYNNKA